MIEVETRYYNVEILFCTDNISPVLVEILYVSSILVGGEYRDTIKAGSLRTSEIEIYHFIKIFSQDKIKVPKSNLQYLKKISNHFTY